MDIVKKFGLRIKQLRLNNGMSQGGLSKKLGVGASYVSKIERGEQNVSLRGLDRLAKALGVSVNDLLK